MEYGLQTLSKRTYYYDVKEPHLPGKESEVQGDALQEHHVEDWDPHCQAAGNHSDLVRQVPRRPHLLWVSLL